ncbi:multicopper oxidase domain-containing protein [Paenibacillus macerans]|uniref:multicopper oxidase domain-containing protein n=1 Tax=Paenibacillus macerans TaxID=44252 RepID=UPI003D322382
MVAAAWLAFPSGHAEVGEAAPAEEEHKLNQPPVKPVIEREGNVVHIEMTAQTTDLEISEGVFYNAWTFNGTAPGPVIRVKEGDTLEFTLTNMDPEMPHSMDFHAVHAAPSRKFIDVMPDEKGIFTYPADTPGVFMYHCGTSPVLLHVANGMHGMIIVEPKDGYETDTDIDREYTIVQSEWYAENDYDAFQQGEPEYVVFNGDDFTLKEHPFLAKVGDKVRLYVTNSGPNHVSSFHVVGTTMDRVYLDGNPNNVLYGLQTVMLPAGGGAVVEFTVTEEGDYPILTHQLADASKGATAILRVTADGKDNGEPGMSH